jgi:hypothetical protein
VSGTYSQSSTGMFNVEVGGSLSCTSVDALNAGSSVTLAGTLTVVEIDGCVPTAGQNFVVMTFVSRSGTFAGDPPGWTVAYNPTNVTITRI